MSKYTKIIAALGVAAGLGVASLPFGAFADEYTATGKVDVQLTVPDVITMTIDGTDLEDGDDVKSTKAIDLGEIEAGKSAYSDTDARKTVISVKTNKPNGYSLQATGSVLTNENKTSETIRLFSAPTALKTEGNKDEDEGWGINVAFTAPTDHVHAAITGTNFSQASKYYMPSTLTEVDKIGTGQISEEATFEYTISYGANVQEGKAAGVYKGTATYVTTGIAN